MSNITNLAAASNDKEDDSIVYQDFHVVLADVPNHSILSQQKLQGEVLDDDLDEDDDNDNHFGEECNATVYDGRKNTITAVCQARLSASPSSAKVAASIAPDLSTLSRNGMD